MRRLRYEYGAGPLHLFGVLAMTLVAGYAAYRIADVSSAAGYEPSGYLTRWLLITAAMFAVSAVAYAYSARRFRGPPTPAPER